MPRNSSLSAVQLDELRRSAARLGPGKRRPFVEEQAELLGVAVSTVYRALEGGVRTRKRRSDAGAMRAVDEPTFRTLAAMVVRYDYDAELAIDTYNANRAAAGLEEISCHPETFRRWLRTHRVSRRDNSQDLRVHRRWEAPYPGYLMQIDSTCAHSYYIDRDDTIGYEAAVSLNKNKAGNGRPRVWLICMVDDHTRVRWARFYTSESGMAWLDLMLRAWRKPEHPEVWPAYGVPERVYADNGSGITSALMQRAMDALEVRLDHALPSSQYETNAQAKGKVEAAVRVVQAFEKITRWRRFESLEEMNQALGKFMLHLNRTPHSETGMAPFARWLGAGGTLRVLPDREITARLSFQHAQRVLRSDCSVQLKVGGESRVFQLPRRAPFIDYLGKRIDLMYLDADPRRITVVLDREEHEIEAQDAVPDVAGEFHAAPTTAAVALKRELLSHDLSQIDPHLVLDYRVERTAAVYVGRPQEIEHPLAAAAAVVKMIRRGRAIDRLAADNIIGAPPTSEERAAIDTLFAGRPEIPEAELEEWIRTRGQAGPRLTLVSA